MKIERAKDYAALSKTAADLVTTVFRQRPNAVCVLPTGNTPLGLFRNLVASHREGLVDFSQAHFVSLDEYAGIASDDRRSLWKWLRHELLDPLGVSADRTVAFDSTASDTAAEAARIETTIAKWGGIDLAMVGLGPNGHIGFNEPGSDIQSRARLVELAPESIISNAVYWGSDVPRFAFTLGLGTLLESRTLVLMASGRAKSGILGKVLNGPIGSELPATVLRLHREGLVLADAEALPE